MHYIHSLTLNYSTVIEWFLTSGLHPLGGIKHYIPKPVYHKN